MSFMSLYIYNKSPLYSAQCAKCHATIYAHDAIDVSKKDLENCGVRCMQCVDGYPDPDTVTYEGKQYAGRYSANGYMDCTDWQFSANRRTLESELRSMYGDDE